MATKGDDAHKHTLQLMGKLLDPGVKRDAVHIAVAPVTSGDTQQLFPGQRIGWFEKGNYDLVQASARGASSWCKEIGIVDPYLPGPVHKGDRFFMYLFPMSTNSLRHQWTHPDFDEEAYVPPDSITAQARARMAAWAGHYGYTADKAIEKANEWLGYDEWWCDGGTFEGESIYEGFWNDFQIITGKSVPERKAMDFTTCRC